MKKLFYVLLIAVFTLSVFSFNPDVTEAAKKQDDITVFKNQIKQKDAKIIELNEKVKALEAKVKALSTPALPKAPSEGSLTQTVKDVTVKIDKVVQDSDSLKIYVTYINNSKKSAMTGDSLTKIVANGKQYGTDSEFSFDRYYDKDVPHAADFIEPGVTEQSVIFLKPVTADKINIVLNANFDSYRFNDVKIQK